MMPWLDKHLSIRQTAYALLVFVVLTTVIGSIEVILAYHSERERMISTMNQWFESVADTSARAAYHVDERQATAVLDGLMKFKTVASARITTDLGVVLAERTRRTDSSLMDDLAEWLFGDIASQQRALSFDRSALALASGLSEPGDTNDMLVGIIELAASPQRVVQDFLELAGSLIAGLVLESFLLAAALVLIFHRTLTRSLLQYADKLGQIDPQSTTIQPVSPARGHESDELGLVVSRTNGLLKRIFDLREAEALAKHDLEESERRFRSTFENVAVGIVDLDENQCILHTNSRMGEMLGYEIDALIGMNLDSFVHPEDVEADKAMRAGLTAGETPTYVVEKRFIRNDGRTMYGNITVSLVEKLDNIHRKLIAVIQDVTHSKEQEVKIEAQREALIHRERVGALGSLLAGVAHELNNPLAIVIAQAELLAETATDEKTQNRAAKILKPAERCTRIVRTFLALARRREIKKTHVNVEDLISDVCELLEYQFRNNDIELVVDIAPNLPAIWGDNAQLSQALINLLVNAQQALEEVSTHRALYVCVEKEDEQHIAIEVRDNGAGIPDSIQTRIFEPFFTTKPEGQGTGLGLSYCQSVAESHDGTIEVKNSGTVGTVIRLELPVGYPGADRDDRKAPAAGKPRRPLRVLVVDDEAELLDTILEGLEHLRFSPVGCADAGAAIDALSAEEFDLILTDIRMPGIDGPAFYEEVSANNPGMRERFVFITGDSLNERASHFIENTNALCIYKPFEMRDLEVTLHKAIARLEDGLAGKVNEQQVKETEGGRLDVL